MAKIGTAHVEIKPVISDEALAEISARIEEAVRAGVAAGLELASEPGVEEVRTWDGTVIVRGRG